MDERRKPRSIGIDTENSLKYKEGFRILVTSEIGGDKLRVRKECRIMARKEFTDEVLYTLRQNPYTLNATRNRLSLTLEAKEKILEMDEQGKPWRQIIEELGYDTRVLGKWRARNMVRNAKRDAESPNGVHEGYIRTAKKRLSKEDIDRLEPSPSS